MTPRQEIERDYEIEDGRIKSPGKFENEMIYAPYFWESSLNGIQDNIRFDGDVPVDIFYPDKQDLKQFPELQGVKSVEVWEDDQGFVHCHCND